METLNLKKNYWSDKKEISKEDQNLIEELLDLISKKKRDEIKAFLNSNPRLNINRPNHKGVIPIHFATFLGDILIIESLLSGGADLNICDLSGKNPLDIALEKKDKAFIYFLIEQGSLISKKNWDHPIIQRYFIGADDFQQVTDLEGLEDVKNEDFSGVRDLSLGEIENVLVSGDELYDQEFKQYVGGQGDVNNLDFGKIIVKGHGENEKEQITKVQGRSENGEQEIVKILGSKEENETSKKVLSTTEHLSDELKKVGGKFDEDDEIIKIHSMAPTIVGEELVSAKTAEQMIKMAEKKNIRPEVLFIVALKTKNQTVALKLLDLGLDSNSRDVKGSSFLMLALHYHQNDVVKSLIERGASIHYRSLEGKTALSSAVLKNNVEGVRQLVLSGVNLNIRIKQQTCLMFSVYQKFNELAKVLVEGGIDVNAKDVRGNSALDYALQVGNQEMVDLLSKVKFKK